MIADVQACGISGRVDDSHCAYSDVTFQVWKRDKKDVSRKCQRGCSGYRRENRQCSFHEGSFSIATEVG